MSSTRLSSLRTRVPLALAFVTGVVGTLALTHAGTAGANLSVPAPIVALTQTPDSEVLCRGPFKMDLHNEYIFLYGERNRAGAGETGAALAPGSCAWADQPLADDEPQTFVFRASPTAVNTNHVWMASLMSQLAPCAASSGCVVRTHGRNGGVQTPGWFVDEKSRVTTSWPVFRTIAKKGSSSR
ncbi:MAG: hypothetical protein R3A79_19420 [Nannocystaceae bacterium]